VKAGTGPKAAAPVVPAKAAQPTNAARPTAARANPVWSRLSTRAPSPLAVGAANSPRERDADRVAERASGISRSAAGGSSTPSAPPVSGATQSRLHAPGAGAPVAPQIRRPVESVVGRDLSHARVHATPADRATADALRARAFTVGNHIWVGSRGSPSDARLMSHELAHVAQPSTHMIQRDPIPDASAPPAGAPTPAPAPPTSPPSPAVPSASPQAAPPTPAAPTPSAPRGFPMSQDSSVIELKGRGRLMPSAALASEIESMGGNELLVPVRFGEVAQGMIPIRWTDQGYKTPSPPEHFPGWGIQLRHPAFPFVPGAEPTLYLEVDRGVVVGGMGWKTPLALADDPDRFKEVIPVSSLIAGLSTFQNVKLVSIIDVLRNGKFIYHVQDVTFDQDDFHGTGTIHVEDESYKFEGGLDVPVTGLPASARMPLKREPGGGLLSLVSGSKTWQFNRKIGTTGRLTATISATLSSGEMTVRGTGRYDWRDPKNPDRRISGGLTIIITNFEDARQAVLDHLGDDAPSTIEPAAAGEELAITGWGELDLALSDWINGNAEVIVHPEGYVTARGEILPKKVIGLAVRRQKEWPLAPEEKFTEVLAALPIVGDLRVEASVGPLIGSASFGPGALHDLRITGLISSDPNITNRFEVGGVISAPGEAALHLKARLALSAYLAHLKEAASASLNATGDLRLKVYIEADAAVGRRAGKKSAEPEYYLQAHAEAMAGLDLAVKVTAKGSLALLGDLDLDLIDRVWPLGGAGARLDLTYVFGRGNEGESALETKFDKIDFDDHKFAKAIARGKALEAKGFTGEKKADTKSESEVVNPDAPAPFHPPDANAPAPAPGPTGTTTPAAPSTALVKVLDEPFHMDGEPHTLHLALIDPPSIDMESPPPREKLLTKISRARKAAEDERKKADAPTAAIDARLTALKVMERQAQQVLDAAVKVKEESPYLTPHVPGYADLAESIEQYGAQFHTTDLAAALAVATVDPSKPESVLQKYPNLAKSETHQGLVARILEQGASATKLRQIFDFIRTYGYSDEIAEELLRNLFHIATQRIVGWEIEIDEMASQRTKARGGEFTLRYIGRVHSWGGNVQLEAKTDDIDSDRRWDAWIEGALYQFKAWRSWGGYVEKAFLRQMVEDYGRIQAGIDMPLYWVFNGEIPLGTLHDAMEKALRAEIDKLQTGRSEIPGASLEMLTTILGQIRRIVKVYK
jgi:hypothetical protein